MYWYLLFEFLTLLILLAVFRRIAIEMLTSAKFWKIVAVWAVFILGIAEVFAYYWNLWNFTGEYLFGTTPLGFPLVEEFIFVILSALSISCSWAYFNKR